MCAPLEVTPQKEGSAQLKRQKEARAEWAEEAGHGGKEEGGLGSSICDGRIPILLRRPPRGSIPAPLARPERRRLLRRGHGGLLWEARVSPQFRDTLLRAPPPLNPPLRLQPAHSNLYRRLLVSTPPASLSTPIAPRAVWLRQVTAPASRLYSPVPRSPF